MEPKTNSVEPAYKTTSIRKLVLPVSSHGRIVFKLTKVFHFYSVELGYVHYASCTGVLSRFRNTGLQAVFADFDTGRNSQAGSYGLKTLSDIEKDIAQAAARVHGLGSFFIFESSAGHFHAIDFSLHDVMDVRRFLAGLEYGDHKYLDWLVKHGENTVRISEKRNEQSTRPIRFVKFLQGGERSLVHHGGLLSLFESIYPEIRPYTSDLVRDGSSRDDLYVFDYRTMTW